MGRCQGKMAVYSRIVGYIRPTYAFNHGKKAEFKQRKVYNVQASMQGPGPAKLRQGAETAHSRKEETGDPQAEAEFARARQLRQQADEARNQKAAAA